MFKKIKWLFRERAEEKVRQEKYGLEEARKQYKKGLDRVNGRVNLRKRIETELSQKNCPVNEIVSRYQSVITDRHFKRFLQSPDEKKYTGRKYYFELSDVFEKEGLDVKLYTNDAMVKLFIETAITNAGRVTPEDSIDFMKTLLEEIAFYKLDVDWVSRDDYKLPKYFLAQGLVPLAARVHEENKVEFFHACESDKFLRIMGEVGNPEDFAAFMYNIFGAMERHEVDDVLSQSDIMALLKKLERDEAIAQAFDKIVGSMNPLLANTLKKYIGYEPIDKG